MERNPHCRAGGAGGSCQRHARGYTPTEAGEELLRIATVVDDQFSDMMERIESARSEISGQLVITTIPVIDRFVMPAIAAYQALHPKLQVLYHSDVRTYHLAHGEAHVALRAGTKPNHPDNVVSQLFDTYQGLFASPSYVARYGLPKDEADLINHRFVVAEAEGVRAPFHQWLSARVPEENFAMRTSQVSAAYLGVQAGLGIGFLNRDQENDDMIEVFPDLSPKEWCSRIWLVTHVDLHRSPKVQSFTRFLQERAKAQEKNGSVLL